MPDEVAANDNGTAPGDRRRCELTDEFLRDLSQADAAMRSGGRGAPQFALAKTLLFAERLAALERDLGRFSGPAPDVVLARIAHALTGLEEGTVDPILAPDKERRRRVIDAAEDKYQGNRAGSTANVLAGHATAAAAMTILMLAGRGREDAAQEAAKILKDTPLLADSEGEPWRTVARWRDEIRKRAKKEKRELPDMQGQGVDFRAETVGRFNYLTGEAQRLKQAGATSAQLVRIAHDLLDHGLGMGENSGLARAKSERPKV